MLFPARCKVFLGNQIMTDYSSRPQYTGEEASHIIRLALEKRSSDTISHQDLIDTAEELGLDEATIKAAIRKDLALRRLARKVRLKKKAFNLHLYSYIGVNLALFIINALTPGPWWFQWSVFGWGVGLLFHYKAVTHAPRLNS